MSTKIAISGDLGSGKSTIGKIFENKLGLKFHSGGSIFRLLAGKYNMTPAEFSKYSEIHPEVDEEIDGELVKISQVDEDMAIDSRMAWHFVEGSFKVHLLVDTKVAAKRIMDENRGSEKYKTIEEAVEKIKARKASENKRYTEKYNVDPDDLNNYDLVVDTTYATPDEICELIEKYLNEWKSGNTGFNKVWTKESGVWANI